MPDALSLASQGWELEQQGFYEEACILYLQAWKSQPESLWPEALNSLGINFSNQGELKLARQLWEQAITQDPTYGDSYFNLGMLLKQLGDISGAILNLTMAATLYPDWCEAHYQLGLQQCDRGHFLEAEISLKEAIKLNPHWAAPYHTLGMVYSHQQLWQQSSEALQMSINISSDYHASYDALMHVWIKQGKLKTAIDYFQQQAILNPNNGAIYFNLAIAFGKIEKIDQAITNYERAVSLYANVTNSLEELARIYMFHKNVISKSVSLIQKSLEYDRNNPISWSYLLMYFFVLGDFGKSENCIRKIFELDSNHVGGKHWIQSTNQFIRFLLKMMDIACCQQLESHYNQALTEIIRGLIHQQQGETTLAMSCYQTAVDINPKLYLAHLNLGLVYESQNREDDALESWKQAIINQASY